MSKFWKGVGGMIGAVGGATVGIAKGAAIGIKNATESGNLSDIPSAMDEHGKKMADKGADWGEDALPEIAKGVTTIVVGGLLADQVIKKDKDKK